MAEDSMHDEGARGTIDRTDDRFRDLARFLRDRVEKPSRTLPAVSLFSNAGVGDYGLHLAGFDFRVHAELDAKRCALLGANHPSSSIVQGNLHETWSDVVEAYRAVTTDRLALLAASPPCQGMSSTNQRRGRNGNSWRYEIREDDRNYLYDVIPAVAETLRPRLVLVENVPGVLVTGVREQRTGRVSTVAQALRASMSGYREAVVTLQMADYGVPQQRLRTFFLLVHEDEGWFQELIGRHKLPFPSPSHGPGRVQSWLTLGEFLRFNGYPRLDGADVASAVDPDDPLHFVPTYDRRRYEWIARNPPHEGRSCFQTLDCDHCGRDNAPKVTARCRWCRRVLRGVPRVTTETNHIRPVRGRRTAYKRMDPRQPAATITTASGHLGSDNTLHPWENRVLSIRECADIQTIPRAFRFSTGGRVETDLSRAVIGEAVPPYFTFRLGRLLHGFLTQVPPDEGKLLTRGDDAEVFLDRPRVAPVTGAPPVGVIRVPSLNGGHAAAQTQPGGGSAPAGRGPVEPDVAGRNRSS